VVRIFMNQRAITGTQTKHISMSHLDSVLFVAVAVAGTPTSAVCSVCSAAIVLKTRDGESDRGEGLQDALIDGLGWWLSGDAQLEPVLRLSGKNNKFH